MTYDWADSNYRSTDDLVNLMKQKLGAMASFGGLECFFKL